MIAAGVAAAVTAVVVQAVAAAVAALMVTVAAAVFAVMVAAEPEYDPLMVVVGPAEKIAGDLGKCFAATEMIDLTVAVGAVCVAADALVSQGQTSQAFASSIVAETKYYAS